MKLLDWLFGKDTPTDTVPFDPALQGVTDADKLEAIALSTLGAALVFEDAAKDGVSLGDAPKLIGPVLAAGKAWKHLKEAGVEIQDLTKHESEQIVDKLMARMGEIDNTAARLIAEKTLACLPTLGDLISTIGFVKSGPMKTAEPVT